MEFTRRECGIIRWILSNVYNQYLKILIQIIATSNSSKRRQYQVLILLPIILCIHLFLFLDK